MLLQSEESCDSNGKSVHANVDIDTHYDVIKDVNVPGEFRRPHMNINTVSMEQQGDDYIKSNADLETRPQIRSTEQMKCMYSECLDGIDAKQGYQNVNAASLLLTTFYTPFKR